jgi:outer membrane protein OmpA-like peptidoglycan-associated protein
MITSKVLKTSFVLILTGAGCATAAPPADLVAARTSYTRAQQGRAAQLDPADLHTAEQALAAAEQAFSRDGDTQGTRDLAYVAQRRAQIAEARAATLQSNQNEQKTIGAMRAEQAGRAQRTSAQLGQANEKLAVQGQELATEREGRAAADKRAAQATSDLAKFASVKQEPRGLVITLSGGVLFPSSQSTLPPDAQLKLNSVADSLTQQDPDSKMVVEGHTDSQGGQSFNQELSQRRAQTVRDYLVSRGIAADRVTSQGYGSSHSVADNSSPEGRANNRRVEIVVVPAGAKTL